MAKVWLREISDKDFDRLVELRGEFLELAAMKPDPKRKKNYSNDELLEFAAAKREVPKLEKEFEAIWAKMAPYLQTKRGPYGPRENLSKKARAAQGAGGKKAAKKFRGES